jgi:hypothetical protein
VGHEVREELNEKRGREDRGQRAEGGGEDRGRGEDRGETGQRAGRGGLNFILCRWITCALSEKIFPARTTNSDVPKLMTFWGETPIT